jgi:glycosyltransferase involved in cell wall biosynthesis
MPPTGTNEIATTQADRELSSPLARRGPLDGTVLQINSVTGGSTGTIALGLSRGIEQSGARAWVAYGRGGAAPHPRIVRIGGRADAYAHGALTRIFDRHGLGSTGATRAFIRWMKSIAPDVVHLHNLHGYYLNFELLFDHLRSADVPVVWTLHDCWAFTGHCTYYDRAACVRWQTRCARCPQKHEYPASWVADASARMFDRKRRAFTSVRRMTIVTPSEWLAGEVRRSFLKDYPTHVIPNGIALDAFAPRPSEHLRARLGIAPGMPVVLGVGGFGHPRKGMPYLVALGRRISPEAKVVLVGVPRRQLSALPDGIVGVARTDSVSELAEFYSLASVFVNPTLEDNFPTVTLEALAAGTPVVTFATGGCPEQIAADTGVAVTPHDLDGLERAVREVISKGRAHFAAACRARASTYSVAAMVRSYLRVYEAAMNVREREKA